MNKVLKWLDKILDNLSGKVEEFYLAGGTALSKFYFQHRESYDLDFFTRKFSNFTIDEVVRNLAQELNTEIELTASQEVKGIAKQRVYRVKIDSEISVKLDFIEDVFPLLKRLQVVNGIPVLSKEDIYLRKILTACGSYKMLDDVGREVSAGGRQEAKDFFDLFYLSATFMPLSKFADIYCDRAQIESIIIWYRSYDRLEIKTGLLEDIITDKKPEFRVMEKHFEREIYELVTKGL